MKDLCIKWPTSKILHKEGMQGSLFGLIFFFRVFILQRGSFSICDNTFYGGQRLTAQV